MRRLLPLLATCALLLGAGREEPPSGRQVFRWACTTCHGTEGDGAGPSAADLDPAPRDFTRDPFKLRSTESGEPPLPEDLERTVDNGMPGTWMPAWGDVLTAAEIGAVVRTVRDFQVLEEGDERWGDPAAAVRPAAETPPLDAGAGERGVKVYERLQCAKCHGETGLGDGPAADEAKDDAGNPVPVRDFTVGIFKGGTTPQDVYRTYMTGMDGTPMPSYFYSVPEETDRWDLVAHTLSLRRDSGLFDWLFRRVTPWR